MIEKKRPNIVFLFTDDQRFDTLHGLGNPDILTPNMDALLADGCAFTQASIMGGTSGAVCMPSRAMVMTGRSLFHLDDMGQTIPAEHIMLPEWLREQGNYFTYGLGKWHNSREAYARGFDGGAKIFFGGMNDHWNVPAYDFDPSGAYQENGFQIEPGKHSSELFADEAVAFLQNTPEQPFFLYTAFMAPHDPRTMPKEFLDLYDPNSISLPNNFMPEHPFDNGELLVRDELLAAFPRTEREIRNHIADYYAMITHLDYHIGRIIAALKDVGLYENTVIVLAGDNGLAIGRHGLMGKQNLYEHSVRVPLIFTGPGVPAASKSEAFAYLFDIFPTLCELTGLQNPESVDGKSLTGAMHSSEEKVRDNFYYAYRNCQRAVRDQQFKLIEYVVNGQRRTQLFDEINDPDELHDLSNDGAYQEKREQLHRQLLADREAFNDHREREAAFWQAGMDAGKE